MAESTILGAVRAVVLGAIGPQVNNRIFEIDAPDTAAGMPLPQAIVDDGGAKYSRNSEADQTAGGGYEVRRVKIKIRSKTQHNAQAILATALQALCPVVPAPPAVQVAGATTTYCRPADGQVTLKSGMDPETGLGLQEASTTLVIRVTRP